MSHIYLFNTKKKHQILQASAQTITFRETVVKYELAAAELQNTFQDSKQQCNDTVSSVVTSIQGKIIFKI